ncbi:hypothetical protein F4677DRAFT_400401 [Hypoxylon crocopeplum]|nr:hypothetical protein F4677DRAFT_400401 [Hypoxylon crocopeplum]
MDVLTCPSVGAPTKVSNILDFPDEILKAICGHCSQSDWVCLSLICKRFRDLAAAELYRNFHIVFPDEDDPNFDSPIDGLAGGLETFVSSDYDYAKHLRQINLDTLSVGERAAAAHKPYSAGLSCGKFMNILFLLTIRKATALDTFRWNIRVELSRPVYKILHGIKSLRHVHIRLQAGPSLYQVSRPLPLNTPPFYDLPPGTSATQWANTIALHVPPSTLASVSKSPWKERVLKALVALEGPPTISGFKNLETLSVLDIDSRDIITEIKICVRNSSSTLRKLKLSFSDDLAMRARKPPTESDLDESEDDDFQAMPPATSADYDNNWPAMAFQAQEERKAQESVLGRIFDLEQLRTKPIHKPKESGEDKPKEQPFSQEGQRFIHDVTRTFERMASYVNGTSDFSRLEQQEGLDVVTAAARKFVQSEEAKAEAEATADELHKPSPATVCDTTSDSQLPTGDLLTFDEDPKNVDGAVPKHQLGYMDQPSTDIDLTEVPVEDLARSVDVSIFLSTLLCRFHAHIEKRGQLLTEADTIFKAHLPSTDPFTAYQSIWPIREKIDAHGHVMSGLVEEVRDHFNGWVDGVKGDKERIRCHERDRRCAGQYTRDTRGIGLHSLGIHLIPIKASVLGKAIDLRVLKQVTLLNVGEQNKFWTLMRRENSLSPLPLRQVFTDDVCLPFLQLISELECVNEVLMLQRSPKYQPASLAPNPATTIEQIRKLVLKIHMPTIERLMIKNQADDSWDVDGRTIRLICRQGQVLKELAIIMGMSAIHAFVQNMHGLPNLRALQLISFRTEDTCLSVVRETRRFIVDALSHLPELKLEWIALANEDHAMRILRKEELPKLQRGSAKGKEPAASLTGTNPYNATFPVAPGFEDSESEDDEYGPAPRQKLQLLEGIPFYDIFDIVIFKKEIANGRL